ncbi:MAG: quinol monooxygenase YgiN [Gammaproteobacteria bacterium]|jgi:quinol monooxygenase YgiN
MATAVTIDLSIDPARKDEFLGFIKGIAPDTRSYAGCVSFDILTDQDKPGHVLFYELWDSRGHQEKYLAWRTETGLMDKLGPFLTAPPTISYLDKFDG